MVALACGWRVAPALADDRPVVAVLYFDNNTGNPEFDVLKKGFADMMITDLASVEGMVVVERDRLEALLAEIRLQRAAFFDKRTAVKLGKGLGARYAVTGAFYTAAPQLRIDVRLIEIATGKVMLSSKVVGAQTEIYSLEQALVSKFVIGLKLELIAKAVPQTKVPDLGTLLDYSKSVDLGDQGEYEAASQAVAEVIRKAPAFALARLRKDEFLKRLEKSQSRREQTSAQALAALRQSTERYFAKPRALKDLNLEEAKAHMAFRAVRGRFVVLALSEHLYPGLAGSLRVVKLGHERQAARVMAEYESNQRLLIAELAEYRQLHGKSYPNGLTSLDDDYQLPDAERRLLAQSGMNSDVRRATRAPLLALAEFLVKGEVEDLLGNRATSRRRSAPSRPRRSPEASNSISRRGRRPTPPRKHSRLRLRRSPRSMRSAPSSSTPARCCSATICASKGSPSCRRSSTAIPPWSSASSSATARGSRRNSASSTITR
ncbi:MAG: hypothetical protein HC863_02550 [Myxococcales bacterium]|nr:hypothetical protein [Myxococcales bacterium]